MVRYLADPRRTEPAHDGLGERAMLEAWLEYHRTTLLIKCEGMDDDTRKAPGGQLQALPARPSAPHGRGRAQLVR